MNIRGQNIELRAIEFKDNEMLLKMINDEETEYMVGGWSFPISQKNQEEWTKDIENNTSLLRCAIDFQGNAVGVIMLTNIDYKNGNAEVHIKMSIDNGRGKGFATDALMTIVRYSFEELRLKCIYARISQHNEASRRLFKKCGFKEEGVLNCRLYKRGEYINVISCSKVNCSRMV